MVRHVQIKQYVDGNEKTTVVDLDRLTPENSRVLASLPLEERPAAAARLAAAEEPVSADRKGSLALAGPGSRGTPASDGVRELWEAMQQLKAELSAASSRADPAQSDLAGWESFKLPFLKPQPEKPRQRVVFRREGMGVLTARYHAVFIRGLLISLVFDTRYEDADPFVPDPTREGELLQVTLIADPDNGFPEDRTFLVIVHDLHQSLGCLDVINLLIAERG